jgi:hypothetical protein
VEDWTQLPYHLGVDESLEAMSHNLVGKIEVIAEFPSPAAAPESDL